MTIEQLKTQIRNPKVRKQLRNRVKKANASGIYFQHHELLRNGNGVIFDAIPFLEWILSLPD